MMTASLLLLRAAAAAIVLAGPAAAQLQVATLHPLLTDVAQQVGGQHVKVMPLVAPGTDIHHFSPTPDVIKKLAGARLVLVSGKHLENYLDKLRAGLTAGQKIIEVGATIPSLKIDPKDAMFLCCPEHVSGAVDPHWWNSVENVQRAARVIADAFAEADPARKAAYRAKAAAWGDRLEEQKKWARKQISVIPAERRKLATAHLSLSYFAREFGFKLVPLQGLNHNMSATSKEMAAAVETIRKHAITTLFPEQGVNPKYLQQLAADAGLKMGGELIADGNGTGKTAGFEAAFTHNINEIVKALRP